MDRKSVSDKTISLVVSTLGKYIALMINQTYKIYVINNHWLPKLKHLLLDFSGSHKPKHSLAKSQLQTQ